MKKIVYPRVGSADLYPQQTLYDVWANLSAPLGVLGSGSDYTSFLHNGISSVDLGATNGKKDPVYHYHSNYDTYYWMEHFGDPGFNVHVAMGQFLGLLAYHLSSDTLIPFNATTYTDRLQAYYTALEYTLGNSTCCATVDLSPLQSAIESFGSAASAIADLAASSGSGSNEETITLINHKYRDFSRGFVSQGGLPDREFYKHVVFAPGRDTGYAATTYPGITEAVEFAKNSTLAEIWVGKTSRAIEVAAAILIIV
jgi:N-acetylated-alpha-linked acidic dipeptidase